MMIEARFANADFVGDVLKAEAFETARLDQPLRRVEDFGSGLHNYLSYGRLGAQSTGCDALYLTIL